MLSVVAMALVETDLPDDASTPISESTHGQPIMQRAVQAFERLRDRTTAAAQSELPFTPDTEPGVDMEDGEGAVVADADADASRALSLQQHKTASTAVAAWSRRAHTGADWLAGIGDAELRSVELHPVETASRQPPTRRGRDIQRKSVIAGIAPPTGVRTRAHSDWDDVRKALNVVVACRPLSHVCVCVCVRAVRIAAMGGGASSACGRHRNRCGAHTARQVHSAQVHALSLHWRRPASSLASCPGSHAGWCVLVSCSPVAGLLPLNARAADEFAVMEEDPSLTLHWKLDTHLDAQGKSRRLAICRMDGASARAERPTYPSNEQSREAYVAGGSANPPSPRQQRGRRITWCPFRLTPWCVSDLPRDDVLSALRPPRSNKEAMQAVPRTAQRQEPQLRAPVQRETMGERRTAPSVTPQPGLWMNLAVGWQRPQTCATCSRRRLVQRQLRPQLRKLRKRRACMWVVH